MRRFLKKHGCETMEQYDRRYDPDINFRASVVSSYYSGYPHWIMIEDYTHLAYRFGHDYDGFGEVEDWLKENCTEKFRIDFHRVFKQTGIGVNSELYPEWHMNDIGGSDFIFVAFKNEQDLLMFALRWL